MLIYNTTFHVDDSVVNDYISYMKSFYIPEAQENGFLLFSCFARIQSQYEDSGVSFSLQFKVKNSDTLIYWQQNMGMELTGKLNGKFGNKVLSFSTVLEEID